ncbi:MAG: hypothetical protein IPM97_03220 [Bdellovibrionaceae bacterium]|nr:hypothetical protein [Pseudobdellovibrionaceae bacterium]
MVFNGTAWTPVTPAASGVASVVANLPLSVSGSSTSTIQFSKPVRPQMAIYQVRIGTSLITNKLPALANGKILVGNASGAS